MTPAPPLESLDGFIRDAVAREFGRHRAVVGVSGGVDSAVTIALCVRALGATNVTGVILPERESSSLGTDLAEKWCAALGVEAVVDDVTDALEALGCYAQRDSAVRALIPSYAPGKDSVAVRLDQDLRHSRMPALYKIIVTTSEGDVIEKRPTGDAYRAIFAASNYKQRVRTIKLYHHAELRDACVIGTSNLDEEYLGFFVKIGDGTWDAGPLEALTKSSVRELADDLGVPASITGRPTTTDTFPVAEQPQQEMFYSLPFEELDPLLEVLSGAASPEALVERLGWTRDEIDNALHNLRRRHRSTHWNRVQGLRPPSSS